MTSGQEQIADLQRNIADRLRPVCQGIPESSFDELVRQIVAVNLKYGVESEASESVRVQIATQGERDATGASAVGLMALS